MYRQLVNLARRSYHDITSTDQLTKITADTPDFLLSFHAKWCGPCKVVSPTLKKLEQEAGGKWVLVRVNIDDEGNLDLIKRYQVEAVPTMIFFKKGKEMHKIVGGASEEALSDALGKVQLQ